MLGDRGWGDVVDEARRDDARQRGARHDVQISGPAKPRSSAGATIRPGSATLSAQNRRRASQKRSAERFRRSQRSQNDRRKVFAVRNARKTISASFAAIEILEK
jgi:hypothetical protein